MMTYILAVFRKIFIALEKSSKARARRYMINHNYGAWK